MKRILVFAVAAVAAAVPAAGGLLGNQSFASSVPVRAAAATTHIAPRVSLPTTTPTAGTTKAATPAAASPTVRHSADPAGENSGRAKHGADDPARDDRGGRSGGHGADDTRARSGSATIVPVSATSSRHAETGDDHGRHHGSDDDRAEHSGHDDKRGGGDGGKHGGHDDGPNHR